MTNQKVKAEAEKIVLSFIHVPDRAMPPDSNKAWIDKILATRCAIIHVKAQIKENGLFHYKISPLIVARRKHWQSILTELERL